MYADKRIAGLCLLLGFAFSLSLQAQTHLTENVFLIISDGLRWQEVFNGADEVLMDPANGGVKNTNALRKAFWRENPQQRRETLFPFFWNVIASNGQLIGNQGKGSVITVSNGLKFSYPAITKSSLAHPIHESITTIKNQTRIPISSSGSTLGLITEAKSAFSERGMSFLTFLIANAASCRFGLRGSQGFLSSK